MIKFIAGYIWTQIQTTIHRFWVFYYTIKYCIKDKEFKNKDLLIYRSLVHDLSKYKWDEAKHFAEVIFDLKKLTYGSEEYKKSLEKIKPAIKLHYSRNYHHPEYFKEEGIKRMSESVKIEMIIDWRSATRRHKDGDILKSIEINQKRFGYNDEDKKFFIKIAKILN